MKTMRSIAILFLLAASCPVHAGTENVNLVKNSSFEFKSISGSAGQVPLYWSQYTGTPANSIDRATDHKHGECSVKLIDNSVSTSVAIWSDAIPSAPAQQFTLRAWAKKSTSNVYSSMYLKFINSTGQVFATWTGPGVGSVGSWSELSATATAPAGTTSVRVLLLSGNASSGITYFDCVSLTRTDDPVPYALRYASPNGGNGNGTSYESPAKYTNASFWINVNNDAATGPVRVVLLAGNYTKKLTLSGIGNASNRILISGETPYAVNYCDTDGDYFISITNSRNITFRHLHFTATELQERLTAPGRTYEEQVEISDYDGVIELDGSVNDTYNIRFEGVSFTHMLLAGYDMVYAHGPYCRDISWDSCDFVTIGYDPYDHCLYSSEGSFRLAFTNCFFQDCAGPYVRFRSGAKGSVQNCTFISTGNTPTADHLNRVHWPFIQVCAFVLPPDHPDETLGDGFTFTNNSYTYEQIGLHGYRSPYEIAVSGPAPSNHNTPPWNVWHLVDPDEGLIIEGPAYAPENRNFRFLQYFGVDLMANYHLVANNAYAGCWDRRCRMSIIPPTPIPPDTVTYWTRAASEKEIENVDLDELVGIDTDP